MIKKIIHSQKASPSRSMGPHVRQVIPSAVADLDPFVFLDHFGPLEKKPGGQGVPPHPHAGIATITYLFSGSNRHQDSNGHDAVIKAGDLAWMRAGKGIVHAEGMNENRSDSEIVHGLQIWISLPAKDKFIEPDFFHYEKSTLPEFPYQGATVKVICGELMGYVSPAVSLSPAYIFELTLPANTQINLPTTIGDTCGLYMIDGTIATDGIELTRGIIARFDNIGDTIELKTETGGHAIIMGGTPLNEPIIGYASFVMNSEEQIKQVMDDYQNGKMGTIER